MRLAPVRSPARPAVAAPRRAASTAAAALWSKRKAQPSADAESQVSADGRASVTMVVTVRKGDTPALLAARTGVAAPKFVAANKGVPTLTPGTKLRLELPFALSPGAAAAVRGLEAAGAAAGPADADAAAAGLAELRRRGVAGVLPARPPGRSWRGIALDLAVLGAAALAAAVAAAATRAAWARAKARARRAATAARAAPARAAIEAGSLPNALPPWLTGPAVWRVRLAGGGEAHVPLPPPGVVFGSAPGTRCWLAWESRTDAEAWVAWLTAPGGPVDGQRASTVRAAPETLSAEAAASGRELVYVPAGSVRVAPGDAEAGVLAALAAAASPARGGAAIVRPDVREAAEREDGLTARDAGKPRAVAAEAVEVEVVGEGLPHGGRRAPRPPPPPPPPPAFTAAAVGERGWYRALQFAVVPVLRLDGDASSLLTVERGGGGAAVDARGGGAASSSAAAAAATPPTMSRAVIAFEDRRDAERLAWAWHTSGAGAAAGADVARLVALAPAELDACAAESEASVVVFKAGSMQVAGTVGRDRLLAELAAGVAAQLGE